MVAFLTNAASPDWHAPLVDAFDASVYSDINLQGCGLGATS